MAPEDDRLSYVEWKNIENIADRSVYSFSLIVQKMRTEVTGLINSVVSQATVIPLSQSNFVSLVMLFRVRESMLSIELLISKGLARDAAILLVALIEARLEIQYIAAYPLETEEWITANRQKKRAWNVNDLMVRLFKNKAALEKEQANYRLFLDMCHNDPMRNQPSIPLDEDDVVTTSENDLIEGLYCATFECYQILKAAVADLSAAGFTTTDTATAIEELNDLNKTLLTLKKNQPAPKSTRYYPGE